MGWSKHREKNLLKSTTAEQEQSKVDWVSDVAHESIVISIKYTYAVIMIDESYDHEKNTGWVEVLPTSTCCTEQKE